jgi:hypothetical protein
VRTLRPGRWALALVPFALAACSSSPGTGTSDTPQSKDASLTRADSAVLAQIQRYVAAAQQCKTGSNSVVCLETADRTLGGQVHTYANLLAIGHGFTAPAAHLTDARNKAQSIANSLEILGDAQPTQANYDQVLNNFNLSGGLTQLQGAVTKVRNDLSH